MRELLLPRTDAGVVVQAVVLLVTLVAAFVATRDRPDGRLLVVGVGVVTVALLGLRAAH